jgi:hypothetical protein
MMAHDLDAAKRQVLLKAHGHAVAMALEN